MSSQRFENLLLDSSPQKIRGFKRTQPGSQSLHVYIEGDGLAFIRRNQISSNPTPINPIAQKLAASDDTANVLYLARPCQYTKITDYTVCPPALWTNARYSQQVIDTMSNALDIALDGFKIEKKRSITLIGYSGGGVIAALLAAQRDDIDTLVTIAGNLDTEAWTRHHNDSPLINSINPLDYAEQLETIRQFHWTGDKDKVVPSIIIEKYLQQLGSPHIAKKISVPGFDHSCCWESIWPQALQRL